MWLQMVSGTLVLLWWLAAPVSAQNFACTPGSSATDTNAKTFLSRLVGTLNTPNPSSGMSLWASAAKAKIDPLTVQTGDIVKSCPSPQGGDACFANLGLTTCEHEVSQFNLSTYTGLSQVTVSALTVGAFNTKDVATHSAWGPDASLVTDGVFAPEGTTWNNPSFVVVLPLVGDGSAITVNLGSKLQLCGTSACGGPPKVQADRHNMQFEWWDDSTNTWRVWGSTGELSGSGLITRNVVPPQGTAPANFATQYVRLWPTTGADDSNFSVSEIQLRDTTGNIVSTGKVAIGPRPYLITDGVFAKAGTTWNDPSYAVVLRTDGSGNALVIDLASTITICGSGTCEPSIQADKSVFQLDYSLDGTNWISYAQLPATSDAGLQTRGLAPKSASAPNPDFIARYVRIWGCAPAECPDSANDDFSVSEVQLMDRSGNNVSKGALTFGPERVATNDESKPAGADWNDPRYTRILSPCLSNASEKCVQLGTTAPKTGALYVDLTAAFPISGMEFQGDRHQFQVDYYDASVGVWQKLWTVASQENGSGLITRTTSFPNATVTTMPTARYLAIYGTAGDDNNYSVSNVRVFTQTANTACAYASGANSGQPFACSYDAPLVTQLTVPTGLSIAFTVDSASTYFRCTNGTTTKNTTVANIPEGTKCTATFNVTTQPGGGYCSGSCSSGQFVATNVDLDTPTFALTNLICDHSTGAMTDGLTQVAQKAAQSAVQGLFNGLVVNPMAGPLVPSGSCVTAPAADVNGDGKVDCADLAIVKSISTWGKKAGESGFDTRADANRDGIVDIRDWIFVRGQAPAGMTCTAN